MLSFNCVPWWCGQVVKPKFFKSKGVYPRVLEFRRQNPTSAASICPRSVNEYSWVILKAQAIVVPQAHITCIAVYNLSLRWQINDACLLEKITQWQERLNSLKRIQIIITSSSHGSLGPCSSSLYISCCHLSDVLSHSWRFWPLRGYLETKSSHHIWLDID